MTNGLAGKIEQGAAKTSDAIEETGHKAADSVRSASKA